MCELLAADLVTVYQGTAVTSVCRKVGRQQLLGECMRWGVTAVILWLLCVFILVPLFREAWFAVC